MHAVEIRETRLAAPMFRRVRRIAKKRLLAPSSLFVLLSVRMEQLGSHRTLYMNFKLLVPCIFSTYGMKTNWCHYFIRILLDLYMFRAHRPIFGRVRKAVHTTIGSVSVPLCSRALYTEHANRAAQTLNQWLCEQLYELSWRWACGPETCTDPAIYE